MAIVINSSTGEIDLDATTPNTYVVTYTVGGLSSTQNITVNAVDNAAFAYSASSYTTADADPTPTITGLTGGTFSGSTGLVINSTTGEIDLSASTVASHTVTYDTSSSGSSVCPNSSTFSLAVTTAYAPFKMKISVTSGVEKTFNLGISGIGNQFQIDWGDGTVGQANVIGLSHTYNPGGVGTTSDPIITLGAQTDTSEPRSIYFRSNSSALDILEIQQWGTTTWESIYHGFWDARNMDITATDTPIITAANWSNLFYMSSNNTSLVGTSLSNWDVSSATTLASMIMRCTSFNADISNWNVSNVTSLSYMLYGGSSFNQNLSNWDITSLTAATAMLAGTTSLSVANYTDTVVGWAITVYKNSGTPSSVGWTGTTPNFDGTRTSDDASGQTYAAKYGSDWTATGWTNSQDAFDYLTTTLSWTIN